jgi:hypothetical protein
MCNDSPVGEAKKNPQKKAKRTCKKWRRENVRNRINSNRNGSIWPNTVNSTEEIRKQKRWRNALALYLIMKIHKHYCMKEVTSSHPLLKERTESALSIVEHNEW